MRKRRSLPPRPPLSGQALDEVQRIEEDVKDALWDCDDNVEKAIRILRTRVVESLDVQMDHFSSLATYHHGWIVEIVLTTVDSMIGLLPPLTIMPVEQFRGDLIRTAKHHLEQWLATKNKAATAAPPQPASSERTALRDSYLADFTGERIKIIDMCWAAGQHKREWKRWLKGELKDGGTADLAFRRLLTSGKSPKEFRRQLRTPGWE
jgi:hypothetical protein